MAETGECRNLKEFKELKRTKKVTEFKGSKII